MNVLLKSDILDFRGGAQFGRQLNVQRQNEFVGIYPSFGHKLVSIPSMKAFHYSFVINPFELFNHFQESTGTRASKAVCVVLFLLTASLLCQVFFFIFTPQPQFHGLGLFLADAANCTLLIASLFDIAIGAYRYNIDT